MTIRSPEACQRCGNEPGVTLIRSNGMLMCEGCAKIHKARLAQGERELLDFDFGKQPEEPKPSPLSDMRKAMG